MIGCHLITEHAGYCWLNLQHAGSVAEISRHIRANDNAVADNITNNGRRRASMLGRGLVHYLADRILDGDDYAIARTAAGRPFLENGAGKTIAFASISHSHDVVAAALDVQRPIGIDVESHRVERDFRRIAERIFPPAIAGNISSPEIFYQAWCLYEAWGKANNLDHIHPGRNGTLMRLLEGWLNNTLDRGGQSGDVLFFAPIECYAGCVFRAHENKGGE